MLPTITIEDKKVEDPALLTANEIAVVNSAFYRGLGSPEMDFDSRDKINARVLIRFLAKNKTADGLPAVRLEEGGGSMRGNRSMTLRSLWHFDHSRQLRLLFTRGRAFVFGAQ